MLGSVQSTLKKETAVTAYLGHMINPVSPSSFQDHVHGALLVSDDGTICGAGSWNELKLAGFKIQRIVDYGKLLLLPGFVDVHLHLPQVSQVGKAGHTLLEWLEHNIFPAEARFADLTHAQKVSDWFFQELLRNGTTLAGVFTTVHADATDIAFQTAKNCGIRVVMGKVMMDTNSPDDLIENTSVSLVQSEELCRKWNNYHNGRLMYSFNPRFALTCSGSLMQSTSKLWQKFPTSYVHTHLAENIEEVNQVNQKFPNARSYLDVYDSCGLVGVNSIFAHAIYVDDTDATVLANKKSAIAYCPSSNFFLKSGVFAYSSLSKRSVKIGLGSDIAAGPQMSLFGVMKDAAYMQNELWIDPGELLFRATLGGAQALGQEHKLGNFDVGKEADFIILDPTSKSCVPQNILEKSTQEILSTLIYLGDDRFVKATYVRGNLVYENE